MSKFTKALEQAERDRERKEPSHVAQPTSHGVKPRERAFDRAPVVTPDFGQTIEIGPGDLDDTLQSLNELGGLAAEKYRALRNSIEESATDGPPFVLGVSSPGASDGKTVTSINLAGALAQSADSRVLLIDLDLRRGSIPAKLGIRESLGSGFADAIRDPGLSLADIVRFLPKYNLSIIPAGRAGGAPYELLRSPRLVEILNEAKRHYHYIVLDTPPLVPVADCRLIERVVDRLIVVVAASRTPRKLLEEALRLLNPEKLLGFVFNDATADGVTYYSGYEYVRSAPTAPRSSWVSRVATRLQIR